MSLTKTKAASPADWQMGQARFYANDAVDRTVNIRTSRWCTGCRKWTTACDHRLDAINLAWVRCLRALLHAAKPDALP